MKRREVAKLMKLQKQVKMINRTARLAEEICAGKLHAEICEGASGN